MPLPVKQDAIQSIPEDGGKKSICIAGGFQLREQAYGQDPGLPGPRRSSWQGRELMTIAVSTTGKISMTRVTSTTKPIVGARTVNYAIPSHLAPSLIVKCISSSV